MRSIEDRPYPSVLMGDSLTAIGTEAFAIALEPV
jgi:hypothetical protein